MDRLGCLQQALDGPVDVVLCGWVDRRVECAHLRVQVLAQADLLQEVFPLDVAVVVGGCAVACAHGFGEEPALDFFDASLADAEQVLRWFLALGVRANLAELVTSHHQRSSTL